MASCLMASGWISNDFPMALKGFFAKISVKFLKLFWFFSFVVFLYYCNLFGLIWLVRPD